MSNRFYLLEAVFMGAMTIVLGVLIGVTPIQAFFAAMLAFGIKEAVLCKTSK